MSWSEEKYIGRCYSSLRDLSVTEGYTDSEIVEQWFCKPLLKKNFRVVDGEVCQLCGRPDNKYQFRIENSLNGNSMWIGSQCVLNMNFPVFNKEGNTDIKGRIILNSIIENHKLEKEKHKLEKDLEALENFLKTIKYDNYVKVINSLRKKIKITQKEKEKITDYYNLFYKSLLGTSCLGIRFSLPKWVEKILK